MPNEGETPSLSICNGNLHHSLSTALFLLRFRAGNSRHLRGSSPLSLPPLHTLMPQLRISFSERRNLTPEKKVHSQTHTHPHSANLSLDAGARERAKINFLHHLVAPGLHFRGGWLRKNVKAEVARLHTKIALGKFIHNRLALTTSSSLSYPFASSILPWVKLAFNQVGGK